MAAARTVAATAVVAVRVLCDGVRVCERLCEWDTHWGAHRYNTLARRVVPVMVPKLVCVPRGRQWLPGAAATTSTVSAAVAMPGQEH